MKLPTLPLLMYLNESGQGLVEYAVILILVSIVVVLILVVLGEQVSNLFSRVTSVIP